VTKLQDITNAVNGKEEKYKCNITDFLLIINVSHFSCCPKNIKAIKHFGQSFSVSLDRLPIFAT